jgi:hypothetical protein
MRALIIAGMLGLLAATPAAAQNVTAKEPEALAKVLRDAGYKAVLEKDSAGDPMIVTAADGSNIRVLFYNCENNRNCLTVQFYVGFDTEKSPGMSVINQFNREKRFVRAYLDDEGDPALELDVNLDFGGMTAGNFKDTFEVFVAQVSAYKKAIGW